MNERLAHYEILSKIGEGGMGEVWRARDTSLDREVAVKILPDMFAQDPERRARFEREARLLAQLNHPGIAAVHGLHEDKGKTFLAMELVPGEDLSTRLANGPLPVDEALKVGAHVAEALEAAHEQGVIHRDLKPSNIVLMPGGAAKVLDFGLAKSMGPQSASGSGLSHSPTMTVAGTMAGMILGTAAYMSPEQARGKPVDRRTDIWAFGCVLFECLTGKGLFKGETVSDSIGAILHREPDWSSLPAETPAAVRLLLTRCLNRDPEQRLRDIGDARIELEQAIRDPSGSYLGFGTLSGAAVQPSPASGKASLFRAVSVGLAGLILGGGLMFLLRPAPAPRPLRKLDLGVTIVPGPDGNNEARIAPTGDRVVYSSGPRLWVQFLNELNPRPLEGTEGGAGPFWSPDGEQVAYFQGKKLWRISASGGRPTAICDLGAAPAGGFGGAWGEDGRIVYCRGNTGLFGVSALGGEPTEILPLEEGDGDFHEPSLLPDGFVMILHTASAPPNVLMAVRKGERHILLKGDDSRMWHPVYSPSGHILFRRVGGSATAGLWAIPFDAGSLEATGEAFLVAADAASPSLSRDGTLAFLNGITSSGGTEQLYRVDRTGKKLEEIGPARQLGDDLSFSPDGRRLAFGQTEGESSTFDLWVRDMERGTETRLTNDENRFEFDYQWSPDGRNIYFCTFFNGWTVGDLQTSRVSSDGSDLPVEVVPGFPGSVTPDGQHMLLTRPLGADTTSLNRELPRRIVRAPLDGSGEGEPVLRSQDDHAGSPTLSPRGDLLAYVSRASGRSEVFLSRYPEGVGRWQVSTRGGQDVRWGPRGDRLYYREDHMVMEVSVARSGEAVQLGAPTSLFEVESNDFTVWPDGETFLIVGSPARSDNEEEQRIGVKLVADWIREFRK